MERRYLWNLTLKLDNSRLLAILGEEPHTRLDTAVYKTLTTLSCAPRMELFEGNGNGAP